MMKKTDKATQLRRHKVLATGLFLFMAAVYALMVYLARVQPTTWMGYVRAFAEAAMVGALADWFAVTALFHHPLGIPIPHTNLIEKSKKNIGDNLGNFVVSNFLTAANIRPYISKLTVSASAVQWLQKDRNKKLLLTELAKLLHSILSRLDDRTISGFLSRKGSELLDDMPLHKIVANGLQYFLDRNEHEKAITLLAGKIKEYILRNEDLVREKVKSESYFFIPEFLDNKLADKISKGLAGYFGEIEADRNHMIRAEIAQQLYRFAEELRTQERWQQELQQLREGLLSPEKLDVYARDIWTSLKASLQQELTQDDSALMTYFSNTLGELSDNLANDPAMQQKIDHWVRLNAYRYILRNSRQVGTLISNTVGNWQGRELSQKLELEVGKDLQYIRINGTLVGGLVGLLIYAVTHWLG